MFIVLSFWEGEGVLPLMTPVLLCEHELAMVFEAAGSPFWHGTAGGHSQVTTSCCAG